MPSMKLIIPIVVVVVVAIVVALLFLPGMLGGGGTQTTTTGPGTTTPTNQTATKTGKTTVKIDYIPSANIFVRDPTPEEQSRGVLKVVMVYVQLRVTSGTVMLKEISLDNKTTLISFSPTPLSLSAGANYKRSFKVEIKTQAELEEWNKPGTHYVVFKLIIGGKEKAVSVPIVYVPGTSSATIPTRSITFV